MFVTICPTVHDLQNYVLFYNKLLHIQHQNKLIVYTLDYLQTLSKLKHRYMSTFSNDVISAPTSISVSQTVRNGDIVFAVDHDDSEGDTVSFSYVCDPTDCPFDVLDCKLPMINETWD